MGVLFSYLRVGWVGIFNFVLMFFWRFFLAYFECLLYLELRCGRFVLLFPGRVGGHLCIFLRSSCILLSDFRAGRVGISVFPILCRFRLAFSSPLQGLGGWAPVYFLFSFFSSSFFSLCLLAFLGLTKRAYLYLRYLRVPAFCA